MLQESGSERSSESNMLFTNRKGKRIHLNQVQSVLHRAWHQKVVNNCVHTIKWSSPTKKLND